MGLILPGNTVAGKRLGQNSGGLVFVDLVVFQVDDVKIVLAKLLQAAKVIVADGVALVKGGALEFAGANSRVRPFTRATPSATTIFAAFKSSARIIFT